jgi:non-ribosomal peptide synthetase component F
VLSIDEWMSAFHRKPGYTSRGRARIIYTRADAERLSNHHRILHEAMSNTNACRVGLPDRVSLLTSPSTSQGTVITYTALLSGAALCLFDLSREGLGNLASWLATERITVYTSVRVIFRLFASSLAEGQELPELRLIALGGDQVRKSDVELFKKHFAPTCILKIFLSCTEAGNLCGYTIDKNTEIARTSSRSAMLPTERRLCFG